MSAAGAVPKAQQVVPDPNLVDMPKFQRLAERVQEALALLEKPRQINPNFILVSPLNRFGQNPNVNRIHRGILGSILKNSFGNARPFVGVCVEVKSESGIQKLLEQNDRLLPEPARMPAC